MTLTFTGTGGLYSRFGAHVAAIEEAIAEEAASLLQQTLNIEAQYVANNQDVITGIRGELETARTSRSTWKTRQRSYLEQMLIDVVQADNPQPTESIELALDEIYAQMVSESATLDASTVTATATVGSGNTGSAVVVASVKRPDGRNNQYCLSEDIIVTCTGDAQTGGTATAGQEEWTFVGEQAISDTLSHEWPGGSGASGTLTAVDAGEDASAGNLLTNSDFETWTVTNTPDDWTILVGAASTDVFKEVSVVYDGTAALKFTGTGGSPLSSIVQTLSSTDLVPNAVLHFHCWIRKSASLAAGVVEISLVDGSNTQVTDDQAANLATTVAHGTITTSFASFSGSFQLPRVLPTTLKIRVRVSTALTSGESVYIDHLSLAVATNAYPDGNGPWLSVHSGTTNSVRDDDYTVAVVNDRKGRMVEWLDRLFDLRGKGIQMPTETDGSETVADSLIIPDRPSIVGTVDPLNGNNATTLSDAVDMRDFHEAMFILMVGAADEAITFKLTESATSGGSYTDVPGKAATALDGNDDNKQVVIMCKDYELTTGHYFVKADVTCGNGTTNYVAVLALGLRPKFAPASDDDLASVDEVVV